MGRIIPVMDGKKRDAHVAAEFPKPPPVAHGLPTGTTTKLERVIRGTDASSYRPSSGPPHSRRPWPRHSSTQTPRFR